MRWEHRTESVMAVEDRRALESVIYGLGCLLDTVMGALQGTDIDRRKCEFHAITYLRV